MKNLITLLMITALSTSLIINCESSDDSNTYSDSNPIEGRWNFTNVSGGFIGLNQDYKPGVISWSFDTKSSKIVVVNDDNGNQEKNITDLNLANILILFSQKTRLITYQLMVLNLDF